MKNRLNVHESDFALFALFNGLSGLFLDVGANVGQAARSLFNVNDTLTVLSLEPNPNLEPQLARIKRRYGDRFNYKIVGASNRKTFAPLYIPRSLSKRVTTYSSLLATEFEKGYIKSNLRSAFAQLGASRRYVFDIVSVRLEPIDDLKLRPRIIKMDIEGYERWALIGARSTIELDKPIILIEDNTDRKAIKRLLSPLGYRAFYFDTLSQRLLTWPNEYRGILNMFWIHPLTKRSFMNRIRPILPSLGF